MTKLEIVGYDFCPFLQPCIISLLEKQVTFTVTYIEPNKKPEWVQECSPQGATPFLLADGKALFESAIMNDFIDEVTPGSLYPQDAFLKAQNRLWINHSYDLLDHIYEIKTALDPVSVEVEKEKLCTKLGALGGILGDRPFFNGDQFSLIDGAYAPVFRSITLLDQHFETGILADLPVVKQWAANVLSRPSVQGSILDTYEETSLAKIAQSGSAIARRWANQLSE